MKWFEEKRTLSQNLPKSLRMIVCSLEKIYRLQRFYEFFGVCGSITNAGYQQERAKPLNTYSAR